MRHRPATPLPWRAVDGEGQFDLMHAEDGRITSLHYAHGVFAQRDCQRRDSAYIAHACNAYPRLIAALKLAYARGGEKYVREEILALLTELEPK